MTVECGVDPCERWARGTVLNGVGFEQLHVGMNVSTLRTVPMDPWILALHAFTCSYDAYWLAR